jgi:hypothetical protein
MWGEKIHNKKLDETYCDIHVGLVSIPVAYPGFFSVGVFARNFFGVGGSTNSVDDRGQREWRSGGCSPLVRGSTQFANE